MFGRYRRTPAIVSDPALLNSPQLMIDPQDPNDPLGDGYGPDGSPYYEPESGYAGENDDVEDILRFAREGDNRGFLAIARRMHRGFHEDQDRMDAYRSSGLTIIGNLDDDGEDLNPGDLIEDIRERGAEEEARRLRKLQKRISKAIIRSSDPETRRFLKKNERTVRRAAAEAEEAAGLRGPQFRALSRGGPAYGGGSALFDSFVPVRSGEIPSARAQSNWRFAATNIADDVGEDVEDEGNLSSTGTALAWFTSRDPKLVLVAKFKAAANRVMRSQRGGGNWGGIPAIHLIGDPKFARYLARSSRSAAPKGAYRLATDSPAYRIAVGPLPEGERALATILSESARVPVKSDGLGAGDVTFPGEEEGASGFRKYGDTIITNPAFLNSAQDFYGSNLGDPFDTSEGMDDGDAPEVFENDDAQGIYEGIWDTAAEIQSTYGSFSEFYTRGEDDRAVQLYGALQLGLSRLASWANRGAIRRSSITEAVEYLNSAFPGADIDLATGKGGAVRRRLLGPPKSGGLLKYGSAVITNPAFMTSAQDFYGSNLGDPFDTSEGLTIIGNVRR